VVVRWLLVDIGGLVEKVDRVDMVDRGEGRGNWWYRLPGGRWWFFGDLASKLRPTPYSDLSTLPLRSGASGSGNKKGPFF